MSGWKFACGAGLALFLMGCETLDLNEYIPRRETASAQQGMGQTVSTPSSSARASINGRGIDPAYIPRAEELMGADAAGLEALLGQPSLRRSEQTSEVWQFTTEQCVLFVFLYPNAADEVRVSYVTSSGAHQDQQTPGDQQCLEAVARAAENAAPSS